ncbi:MAG: rhomboid family intramembrane serine protease [Gammaproteobacteria bacterium]|nr:rhomboid family intramembrane serine protease [Gammaproteobacteria bacterium]MDE2250626.1 rhomboid family intramembrane serine protease [Gammaproteobacteria bacterium]
MIEDLREVYRSTSHPACRDRALVLTAVNIENIMLTEGVDCLLCVDAADATRALAHLRQYEAENHAVPVVRVAARVYPFAWAGAIVYALVLLGVAFAIANGYWRPEAFENGALDAGLVQQGQWWRAWTALTLHLDANHIVANLGGGIWFGYLAARQLGSGRAWLYIVTGAALANLLEGLLGPAAHRSVGASTAVFTALGLMAAHSWRTRLPLRQSWARRWAPLVAGTVLLGWLGTAGEGTDVVAHLMGFLVGCLLGATAGVPAVARRLERLPQWLAGAAALAALAIAWACALAAP